MNAIDPIYFHDDALASLGEDKPLQEKLATVHGYVRERLPFIARIAIAVYDGATDTLKTYAHSTEGTNPLPLYEARLGDSPSLQEIVARRQARVANDIDLYGTATTHAQRIRERGYGSSYTMPIFRNGEFFGLLFFNSRDKRSFEPQALHFLDLLGHLVSLMVTDVLATPRALVATVRTATSLARQRDFETGTHLDRVAHYARLIAREIAPRHGLTDAQVEHVFLFAPLHDIGKIGIPDEILLKKGKLTAEEFQVMQSHTVKGREIIDAMLANFKLEDSAHANVLRNIAACHHEAMDGSGYPGGCRGEEIPLEARIAAVADVFDALTSSRPYKRAWSIDDAIGFLVEHAETRFDRDCVAALVSNRAEVERIQARFAEDAMG
jgi:HD-GYP domain-containing protein (c-di-GMP phosphodiesterase class II)